jgi:hypothetical protein
LEDREVANGGAEPAVGRVGVLGGDDLGGLGVEDLGGVGGPVFAAEDGVVDSAAAEAEELLDVPVDAGDGGEAIGEARGG